MDLTAKMSKSKKKKLKKRAKRNQQLMDETMQHIVEKEQEQVEGQHAGGEAKVEIQEATLGNASTTSNQKQESEYQLDSSKQKKENTMKEEASLTAELVTNIETKYDNHATPKVNGTSQNGSTVHSEKLTETDTILNELEHIDEDECDELLDRNCKVDGKPTNENLLGLNAFQLCYYDNQF